MDLQALLPQLVPRAIAWAETISAEAATTGDTLSDAGLVIARLVGVQFPEQIRIVVVNQLPIPTDPELQVAALQTGMLGPTMTGLTLGYSIFICQGIFHDASCRTSVDTRISTRLPAVLPLVFAI